MADTSRRALLAGLAATPAALTPALAMQAPFGELANPDAALLELIRRYHETDDASDAFDPIFSAAEDRYERPAIPEALYARASDPSQATSCERYGLTTIAANLPGLSATKTPLPRTVSGSLMPLLRRMHANALTK